MTQTYENLRNQLKNKLISFLKLDNLPYYPPALTICPHCGEQAGILADEMWNCPSCKRHGDVVDYVMAHNGFQTENEAIRHLCRMLGIKNTVLEYMTANEIMDTEYGEVQFVIDKLLSKGLHILAGPSKAGKSWLVLWLAHCVSTGESVWHYKVNPTDVLYLSLEDTPDRIQQRLVQVSKGETGNIFFATEAEVMGNGLTEQLTSFLQEHPSVKFIIIDTLQKIRDMKSEQYSYAGDYQTMTTLKQLANRFDACILVVHHTRKQQDKDPFNMVSGTTGLMGCADSTFVLTKDDRETRYAMLHGTGRDIEAIEHFLVFSPADKRWKLLLKFEEPISKEEKALPLLIALQSLVKERGIWKGTATQLAEDLQSLDPTIDVLPNRLTRILNGSRLVLEHELFVSCKMKKENNIKLITLEALPEEAPHAGEEEIGREILLNKHLKGRMYDAALDRLKEEKETETEAE